VPLTGSEPDVQIDHELPRLAAQAGRVLDEHTDAGGRCAICGEPFPCERVILAAHTIAYQ
jgi:hypothetical protein